MIKTIWLKEMREELFTWKGMAWLLVASLLFSLVSYLLLTNKELSLLDQTEMLWLLGKVIIGVGLLIVAIDASSILTNEFEKETAESLFLAPVGLHQIIWGKLFAVLTVWLLVLLISIPYILVTAAGTHLVLAFVRYTFLLGTLGVLGFSLLILALSLFFRSSKNTLTTSLLVLLTLAVPALFSSTLKTNAVADILSRINPLDSIFASLDNVLVDYQLSLLQNWQFIVPLIVFCLLTFFLLEISKKQFQKTGIVKEE